MITNTAFETHVCYYPLGNTSPVLLTQDLPPEQDADILLLGCGDARSILFTCLVDSTPRKLDITCCDIEPGIQARNVLLYSLLIDDRVNLNVDRIWNIYYHLMLDSESLELLESQIEKLQRLSASLDQWHESLYGSTIRFYDEMSLSRVKSYWSNFSSRGLTPASNEKRLRQLKEAYARAKSLRTQFLEGGANLTGFRATLPATYGQAPQDFSEIADYWWTHGTLPLRSGPASKSIHLNPSFFYSPNSVLTLHLGISPLLGFPLSIANTPIEKTCPLSIEKNGLSSKDRLVASAKCIFSNWASAFRRAAGKTLLIRIHCGDAVHFCFTLVSKCDNDSPTKFDCIDTSNLGDPLGPLNLIALGSVLLKKHPSSSLYTEMLVQQYWNVKDRFTELMGCDVRTVALLLGLVCPQLFTNATNCIEEDSVNIKSLQMKTGSGVSQERSRFRWKRINSESNEAAYMYAEAETLSKFFIDIYYEMLRYERPMEAFFEAEKKLDKFLKNSATPRYNRGSFAFLLSIVKFNVSTDWDTCVKLICDEVCRRVDPFVSFNASDELLLHMRSFGVYRSGALKLEPNDLSNDLIARALDLNEKSPDTLCITLRVPRENLKIIMSQRCCPVIVCSITGKDPRGSQWESYFSSIHVAFGEWSERSDKNSSNRCFVEDSRKQSGTSDMFASFFVPTKLLLKSKHSVPVVRCQLLRTYTNVDFMDKLGLDLCLVRKEITSNDVSITQFVPGTSALPSCLPFNLSRTTASDLVTLRFSDDSSKVKTLVKRIDLQSDAAKALAVKSSAVKIEFKSPLLATVTVANSFKFEFRFPCPVSVSSKNYKVRFGRTSSFIEVQSPLLDPLEEDVASFMFPTFLTNTTSDVTLPTSWIATYIDMDAMPQIDTTNTQELEWLNHHLCSMYSKRELSSSVSGTSDTRTELKRSLFSIFAEFTGSLGKNVNIFGLRKRDSPVETVIIPSCLRLDLVNHSVVLDCALIPHNHSMYNDNILGMFLLKTTPSTFAVEISEAENRAWKALMPAFTERCRTNSTWAHGPDCEYVKKGEIPLAAALIQSNVSPICTCGVGKFPAEGYLDKLKEKYPELNYVLKRYATRAAIAPVFSVPYVEEEFFADIGSIIKSMGTIDKCQSCGCNERKNDEEKQNSLLTCSRCKAVKYCSTDCQKADWKRHKLSCSK